MTESLPMSVTGYLHQTYAESLAEFGKPRLLPRCQGWILERQIPGFDYRDAMGCYPLFTCLDWSRFDQDLDDVGADLVTLSVVTDPFGDYDSTYLQRSFMDVVIPYKEHFIADLTCPVNTFVSTHHRRCARKALRYVSVERCQDPLQFLTEWGDLYSAFLKTRDIKGPAAFSRLALARQLTVPGLIMFRAIHGQSIVGIHLWYVTGKVAYAHLAGYSDLGYQLGASYALFWFAIDYFTTNQMRWLHLGGPAGAQGDRSNGLTAFKRGWATGTRTAYLCGRIFNRERYFQIVKHNNLPPTAYFPAYRNGHVS